MSIKMHKFKIEPTGITTAKTYIDNKQVHLTAVDIRLRPDEVPTVTVDLLSGAPETEVEALLELTDDNLLQMVKRRLDNEEFRKKLEEMMIL